MTIMKKDYFKERYNETHPFDPIVREVYSNAMASVYILQSGKDLRVFADDRTSLFLKDKLMPQNFKHVARILECLEVVKGCEYYVISEPLNRDLLGPETTQSGINLFRDAWMQYLHGTEIDIYNHIIRSYETKDTTGEEAVVRYVEASERSQEEKSIALAMNEAYRDVMTLGTAMIWPLPMNVGVTLDTVVKITNIGIR